MEYPGASECYAAEQNLNSRQVDWCRDYKEVFGHLPLIFADPIYCYDGRNPCAIVGFVDTHPPLPELTRGQMVGLLNPRLSMHILDSVLVWIAEVDSKGDYTRTTAVAFRHLRLWRDVKISEREAKQAKAKCSQEPVLDEAEPVVNR